MSLLARIPEIVCPECKSELIEVGADKLECSSCGASYSDNGKYLNLLDESVCDLAEEIAVQDRVALEYEYKRYKTPYAQRYHAWWTKRMLDGLDQHVTRVLDNGCGIGHLYDFVPESRIVGLDISKEMLNCASQHMDSLILGNSQKLPLADESFSLVFCRSLLHHLPEQEKAIAEIYRVLQPGGKVVFADTNTSLLSAVPRIIANHGEHFSDDHQNMSKSAICKLLRDKFNVYSTEYFGYIAYPLLGFPDLLNIYSKFPGKSLLEPMLMKTDSLLSRIPLLKTQSWGIIVKATKL